MLMTRSIRLFGLLCCLMANVQLQAQAFAADIQKFKDKDKQNAPEANSILFVGSSSFTKWTDINQYFPGFPIINRGFGGSTFPDVIRYEKEIIVPYHPKQVIIYCGDNDLASSDTVTAETVFERFRSLFELIRTDLPGENIVYVSIKPSPSRRRLFQKMEKTNLLIQTYLSINSHTAFVDVFHKMLLTDGSIMPDIFVGDSLHMNAKGYAIWQKAIAPYLSNK
jgi:lysophospholipase L1-like esterase